MTNTSSGAHIQAVQRKYTPSQNQTGKACSGCGGGLHQGGRQQCPAYNRICNSCKRVGHLSRVCRGRQPHQPNSRVSTRPAPAAMGIHVDPFVDTFVDEQPPQVNASSAITNSPDFEPAPTINIHMSSLNGHSIVQVLPDSGADISVAGRALLEHLHEHPDNLLPSDVTPKAINTTKPLSLAREVRVPMSSST